MTLSDGKSEPQVFKTKTVTNAALFRTVDETFYFEKTSSKSEILIEVYDSNEDEIVDDKQLYNIKMPISAFLFTPLFSASDSMVLMHASWRGEHIRKNSTINIIE